MTRQTKRMVEAGPRLRTFLAAEASGGIVLVGAAIVGILWANSPWRVGYHDLLGATIVGSIGGWVVDLTVHRFVNDFLMAVFFFVVGMEIKRELVAGRLRDRQVAALPICAAVGGMVVPALLYSAIAGRSAGSAGWGIPMATDIAFAVGVLSLLGPRVPSELKVLLLALAIVDDIGAIVVIAVFYGDGVELTWLAIAAAIAVAVGVGANSSWSRSRRSPYLLLAAATVLWIATYESGVHATIAGVVLGLLMPARDRATNGVTATSSPCDRLIQRIHPWSSFIVVPLLAVANAGVELTARQLSEPTATTAGVVAGLVVGKPFGILAASWLAVRFGVARLPPSVSWLHVAGVGAVAGIGFTVALFITELAFEDGSPTVADAKIGTLVASLAAGLIGAAVLTAISRRRSAG